MKRIAAKHKCHKTGVQKNALALSSNRRRCLFMLGYQRYQTKGNLDLRAFPQVRLTDDFVVV